jgi:hypothetical protein
LTPTFRRSKPFSAAGHDEESRRREVAGYTDVSPAQSLAPFDGYGGPFPEHFDTKRSQHSLGMIAGRRGLSHMSATEGLQPCEQNGRLHLRAGNGQRVVNGTHTGGSVDLDGGLAVVSLDVGSHRAQRPGHALHGPAHQRLIADQRGVEPLGCEQAHEQADRRAGVPHVERGLGRSQSIGAYAVHENVPGGPMGQLFLRPFNTNSKALQGTQGRQAILAGEKAGDLGIAFGDSTKHQRTMRYGLVTGDGELAFDLPAGFYYVTRLAHVTHITARG